MKINVEKSFRLVGDDDGATTRYPRAIDDEIASGVFPRCGPFRSNP